jgi:hypothetical protein
VFRLLRLIFVLGGLAAITWFGMTVRLGDRTLFEHVQAIWKSHESQDLLRGTKEKVGDLVDRASDKVVRGVSKNGPSQAGAHGEHAAEQSAKPPLEELPAKDRKALRGIIGHGLEKE